MHLKNQPPFFVPFQFQAEIEKCSKAFLMDIVWDYCMERGEQMPDKAIAEFRARATTIGIHRRQARRDLSHQYRNMGD